MSSGRARAIAAGEASASSGSASARQASRGPRARRQRAAPRAAMGVASATPGAAFASPASLESRAARLVRARSMTRVIDRAVGSSLVLAPAARLPAEAAMRRARVRGRGAAAVHTPLHAPATASAPSATACATLAGQGRSVMSFRLAAPTIAGGAECASPQKSRAWMGEGESSRRCALRGLRFVAVGGEGGAACLFGAARSSSSKRCSQRSDRSLIGSPPEGGASAILASLARTAPLRYLALERAMRAAVRTVFARTVAASAKRASMVLDANASAATFLSSRSRWRSGVALEQTLSQSLRSAVPTRAPCTAFASRARACVRKVLVAWSARFASSSSGRPARRAPWHSLRSLLAACAPPEAVARTGCACWASAFVTLATAVACAVCESRWSAPSHAAATVYARTAFVSAILALKVCGR